MTAYRIEAPSRLHFGLFGWGPQSPRQFGGLGLMIEAPGLGVEARPASDWGAEGVLSGRILRVAKDVAARLAESAGRDVPPLHFRAAHAPREHVGLGVGTAASLAVARLVTASLGLPTPSAADLARLTGRGVRSGIGLHGFLVGGLVVEGGHRTTADVPPLLTRLEFPPEWSVLLVQPGHLLGLHGAAEESAFARQPPLPERLTERICRLVLLDLLPAAVERDLATFGAALAEIQRHIGGWFAPVQGGVLAHPDLEPIVRAFDELGLHGAGQSSWGPTLYAFSDAAEPDRAAIAERLRGRFGLDSSAVSWTAASRHGARLEPISGANFPQSQPGS